MTLKTNRIALSVIIEKKFDESFKNFAKNYEKAQGNNKKSTINKKEIFVRDGFL